MNRKVILGYLVSVSVSEGVVNYTCLLQPNWASCLALSGHDALRHLSLLLHQRIYRGSVYSRDSTE